MRDEEEADTSEARKNKERRMGMARSTRSMAMWRKRRGARPGRRGALKEEAGHHEEERRKRRSMLFYII